MERISETFLESILSMLKRAATISSAVGTWQGLSFPIEKIRDGQYVHEIK